MYDAYQLPKALGVFTAGIITLVLLFLARGETRFSFPSIFAAAFYLYSSARLLFSWNHPSFYYGLLFFSPLLFFTAFYSNLSAGKISLFLNIVILPALLYGIYQYSFLGITRPYSSFGNPIFFAEFIAAVVPVMLFSLYYPGPLRLIASVNLSLSVPALIMCSSRGVLISLLISLAAFAWYFFSSGFKIRLNKKRAAFICAAFILICFIPGFSGAIKNAASRGANGFSSGSPEVKNRLLTALASIDIFKASPLFGAGAGAFRRFNPQKQANFINNNHNFTYVTSSYSHNDYLQLLCETGISGFLLFMAFVFSTAISFGRLSSKTVPAEDYIFGAALFSAFIFLICESFFNFPLFSFPSSAIYFIAAGLTASLGAGYSGGSSFTIPGYIKRAAALILAVPAVIYMCFIKPGAASSDFYLEKAMEKGASGFSDFSRSIELEPDNYYALEYYANYLSSAGFTAASIETYKRALAYFPYSPDILYNIASISLYEKNYAAAAQYFESALSCCPDLAAAHLGLFRSYSAMGREKEAQAQLERAVTIDPGVVNSGSTAIFNAQGPVK